MKEQRKEQGASAPWIRAPAYEGILPRAIRPGSMRRGPVFLAAGGKQNRRHKYGDDDWNHKERGSNVHGAGSLLFQINKFVDGGR
jgi:hypothetical protein